MQYVYQNPRGNKLMDTINYASKNAKRRSFHLKLAHQITLLEEHGATNKNPCDANSKTKVSAEMVVKFTQLQQI